MVRSSIRGVLGCFPLLYWRRPASEPELAVSEAGECLQLGNDVHVPVVVEVKCPVDCDWSPQGDAIPAGDSGLVGLDTVHRFRVAEVHGPCWWPCPGRVIGCVPVPRVSTTVLGATDLERVGVRFGHSS